MRNNRKRYILFRFSLLFTIISRILNSFWVAKNPTIKYNDYKKRTGDILEYLVINESKLKIIMTREDTALYGFSASTADYDSPDVRRIFWRILDDAGDAVGFDPKGDKVLIQFYPSRDGGCEIFVTKLGALSSSAARLVTKSENVTMLSRATTLYKFPSLGDLKRAARAIPGLTNEEFEIYKSGEVCFLSITERGGVDAGEHPSLFEFGERCPKEMLYYVREHLAPISALDVCL